MAKGKGEVAGWITRNGVHVPIYGNYTVRGGEEPKAKGSKFKGAGKKRKKVDTSTTSGKTANDLNSNLKKKGLELDSADLSSMAHKDFNDEKVTMYDKDGNTYEGTYNKYKNGDREIVDIKKTGGRDTGKSEVSKGHTEEGKGAVRDSRSNAINEMKSRYNDGEHDVTLMKKGDEYKVAKDLKESEYAETKGWQRAHDELTSKERSDISGKASSAKKEGFFDAEDKKLFDAREKAYETRGLRGQAEESSKVDRKQDAIDYIAKREGVHPSVAKDTYEHMSESERNHVANEAYKRKQAEKESSKATPRPTTPENAQNQSREDFVENLVVGKGYSRNDAEKMADTMGYEKKESSKPAATPTISPKTQRVADNARKSLMFDKGYAEIAANQWSWAGMSNDKVIAAMNATDPKYSYELRKEQTKGLGALPNAIVNHNRLYRTEKNVGDTVASKSAGGGGNKEAKGSIPTTVSGLRSAYSEATGSEKAAIASELRKKGYSLVGGKWVKGK